MKETEPSPENSICTLDLLPVSQFDGDLKGCMLYLSHVYIFLTHLLSLMSKNVDILKKGWSVYSYWSLFSSNSQKNENNGQEGRAHRNLTPILPYQISLTEQRHFHTSLLLKFALLLSGQKRNVYGDILSLSYSVTPTAVTWKLQVLMSFGQSKLMYLYWLLFLILIYMKILNITIIRSNRSTMCNWVKYKRKSV